MLLKFKYIETHGNIALSVEPLYPTELNPTDGNMLLCHFDTYFGLANSDYIHHVSNIVA